MFDFFFNDAPSGHGVLTIDATHFLALTDHYPPQPISDQIFTTGVANPGDINIPKPPKFAAQHSLASENAPSDVQWSTSQHQSNEVFTTGVVNPGDVDFPKPPK